MRVLLTGAAGFIGSSLAEALLARGDSVLGLDNFNDFYDPALKRRNVSDIQKSDVHGLFRMMEADIRDSGALEEAFSSFSPDIVVHLAAYAGVRPSIQNPELYYDVNIMGTVRILEAMVRHGVGRMAFASSSSVYGTNVKTPFSESDNVDHPISPYAATKKAGELLLHTYHKLHNISVACLRFFTVYGPRQRPDLAIAKFARLLTAGEAIPMYGDGETCRDYTYIEDILDGVVKAIDFTGEECRYEIFNLGESHTVSLKEMIRVISETLKIPARIERLPMQPGDVERTFADTTKSRAMLGYAPKVDFEEGIRRYAQWLESR